MKKILTLLGGLLLAAQSSQAWVIKPVWENFVQTNTVAGSNFVYWTLPILSNTWNNLSRTNTRLDGLDTQPALGSLKRYDANRMLLAISENGIAESVDLSTTNAGLYALSQAYPDRSLIWINPTNGNPMGLALTVGLRPVQPSEWYTNFQYVTTSNAPTAGNQTDGPNFKVPIYTNLLVNHYFDFGVSDDGFVYTGYKNKLLRYRPDGSGGLLPTPELCSEMGITTRCIETNFPAPGTLICDTNGVVGTGTPYRRWNSMAGLFACVNVRGSGSNTIVTAGGRGSINQQLNVWVFDTLDATNFFADNGFGAGTFATLRAPDAYRVTSTNPATAGKELWNFVCQYPTATYGINVDVVSRWTIPPYGAGAPTTNRFPAASQKAWGGVTQARATVANVAPALGGTAVFVKRDNTKGGVIPNPTVGYYRGNTIGGMAALDDCPFFVTASMPYDNAVSMLADGFPQYYKPGWLGLHDVVSGARFGVWEMNLRETDIVVGATDTRATWMAIYSGLDLRNNTSVDQPEGAYELNWGNYGYGYGRYVVVADNMAITNIVHDAALVTSTNQFTANTSTNLDYVLQKTPSLSGTPVWTDVTIPTPFPGPYNAPGTNLVDSAATDSGAFYRVKLLVP